MEPIALQAGAQLRDIHGIQGAPWWPPAPGWWLLAAAILALAIALRLWQGRHPWRLSLPQLVVGGWRAAAARELHGLRRRAQEQPPKQTAGELSELLRRIAMARFGRSACAGLTGRAWLRWLSAHDPNGFDWEGQGGALLTAPYARGVGAAQAAELVTLIEASQAWLAAPQRRRAAAQVEPGETHGGNSVV